LRQNDLFPIGILVFAAVLGTALATKPRMFQEAARRYSRSSVLARATASYVNSEAYVAVCRVLGIVLTTVSTILLVGVIVARWKCPETC